MNFHPSIGHLVITPQKGPLDLSRPRLYNIQQTVSLTRIQEFQEALKITLAAIAIFVTAGLYTCARKQFTRSWTLLRSKAFNAVMDSHGKIQSGALFKSKKVTEYITRHGLLKPEPKLPPIIEPKPPQIVPSVKIKQDPPIVESPILVDLRNYIKDFPHIIEKLQRVDGLELLFAKLMKDELYVSDLEEHPKFLHNSFQFVFKICQNISRFKDQQLKEKLKELIKLHSNDTTLLNLATWNNEALLKEILSILEQLGTSFVDIKSLLIETQGAPSREEIILNALKNIKNKEFPTFSSRCSRLKQLQLRDEQPALFQTLSKIPEHSYIIELGLISLDAAQQMTQLLSKISTGVCESFLVKLSNNNGPRKWHLNERERLKSAAFLLGGLSTLPPDVVEKSLVALTEWLNEAPPFLLKYTERLFQGVQVDTMIQEATTVLTVVKDQGANYPEKIKPALEKTHPLLFAKLFTLDTAYWQSCQKTLERYPALIAPFEKWIKKGNPWTENMGAGDTPFCDNLSNLFQLEQIDPEAFEQILSLSMQDESFVLLDHLLNFHYQYSLINLKPLLKLLRENPSSISCFLSKPFSKAVRDNVSDRLGDNLHCMDSAFIAACLKEPNPRKISAMIYAFLDHPQKMKQLIQLEADGFVIWKEGLESEAYVYFPEELITVLQNKKADLPKEICSLPLHEIPEEIWCIDPELPFKLVELRNQKKSNVSIHNLLQEVVLVGREAMIYRVLEIVKKVKMILTTELFNLLAEETPCKALLKEYFPYFTLIGEFTPITVLHEPMWKELPAVLKELDEHQWDSVEAQIGSLSHNWQMAIYQLIEFGSSHPQFIPRLLACVRRTPNCYVLSLIIKAMKKAPNQETLDLFHALPRGPWRMTEKLENFGESFFDLLKAWSTKHQEKDPSLFAHFLSLNKEDYVRLKRMYAEDPALFFKVLECSKKFSQISGEVIELYRPEIANLLATNPEFIQTVHQVGLRRINLDAYKKLGSLYLLLLRINPTHPGIEIILANPVCIKALNVISWKLTSNPIRFADHVLTLASLNEINTLISLLKWMKDTHYSYAERLLDLAKAGYIPEVAEILQQFEKSPIDSDVLDLLKDISSLKGEEIQRGTPAMVSNTPPVLNVASLDDAISKIKRYKDNEDENAKRQKTELSLALAEALISPDGQLMKFGEELHPSDISDDYGAYLERVLSYLEQDDRFAAEIANIKICPQADSPAVLIVRRMFGLPPSAPINDRHAKVAALSAILSHLRQSSGVGSCSATSVLMEAHSHKEGLLKSLRNLGFMLYENGQSRQIMGTHAGVRFFTFAMPHKKMKQEFLDENLLLKAYENTLMSMHGLTMPTNNINFRKGLIPQNLYYFELDQIFGKQINLANRSTKGIPVQPEVILNELRKQFIQLARVVVEYEEPHPVTRKLGWLHLARTDSSENIKDFKSFQSLHVANLQAAWKALHSSHPPACHDYLTKLFEHLIAFTESPGALKEFFPDFKEGDDSKITPWFEDWGAHTSTIIATDQQYVGNDTYPVLSYTPSCPEEMFTYLLQFCDALPEVAKKQYLDEPHRLHSINLPGHAFCLMPSQLLSKLASGKTVSALIDELKRKVSGIRLSDFDAEKRKAWLKKCVPYFISDSSSKALLERTFRWNKNMSFEECGKALWEDILRVYKEELDHQNMALLETRFLEILTPEQQKRMPVVIIGDLNWDTEKFNNQYLACGRSPLTGALTWYKCKRDGSDLAPFSPGSMAADINLSSNLWILRQPISRVENGHLTYKKMK